MTNQEQGELYEYFTNCLQEIPEDLLKRITATDLIGTFDGLKHFVLSVVAADVNTSVFEKGVFCGDRD